MTLETTVSKAVYTGNGATTEFPFSFKVWEKDQILVSVTDAQGYVQETGEYSVTLSPGGGTVSYLHAGAPLPSGWKLAITRDMPFTQEDDYITGTRFDPEVIETGLDRATAERQQLLEQLQRAVILPPTSDETPEQYMNAFWQAVKNVLAAVSEMGKNIGNSTYVTATGSDTPRTLADWCADIVKNKEEQEKLRLAVEASTGGRRTLRFNKDGVPSVFYRLPMYYLDDIISTWPHEPHPAFVVNDPKTGKEIVLREILIGCYEASLVDDKYAVSQPGKLPHTYQPFDVALAFCRANNVPGGISVEYDREHANEYVITPHGELDQKSYFHMMTNAEYSAVALWCWKNGNEPRGNSWYGQNGFYPEEKGKYPTRRYNYDMGKLEDPYLGMPGNTQKYVIDDDPSSGINPLWGNCPTMTGSSPLAWMHDGSSYGIENIVGNVSAMVAGLRVYDGQLQTFANNNAALPDADFCGRVPLSPGNALDTGDYDRQTYYSEAWKGYKAFSLSGELVHPSTANTLKLDGSYMRDGRKTPVYEDGKLVRTYGCGTMTFATKIDVPDSGGTDQTKYSYNEKTGTFYLDPVNGVGNGSAANSFQTLQLAPDNPTDTNNPVRVEDGQPGYLMRALGLYPICAHADLYPSVSQAQAEDRDETDPITGVMSHIKHKGYYYDNGYLTEEIKAAYDTQRGRVWSRVPGDRPAQRGGVYYYEDPAKYSDPDDPNCSLWTTSYANRRYEAAKTNVEGAINVSDIGVGWMNGYRLCVIEPEGAN